MKKYTYILVVWLIGHIGAINAQQDNGDNKIFRFLTPGKETKALFHNTATNAVELRKVLAFENQGEAYLQSFILKGVEGEKGKVLIASVKSPEYFLKIDGSSNTVAFAKITTKDVTEFTWEIVVNSNKDAALIAIQTTAKNRYAIQKKEDGVMIANNVADNGELDQSFSFRLATITNVF
ncbi:exported hypothetical protein [Tenacibaculum maritimum]|uniref:hypothetical protein n=1 Tax=Tenacibaculum maritimum TaxID=107401 RepID=UPI0012E5AC8D|nr:hypothetical protein [Tenacibaculum maritimum]CAA0216624.1 exported hypothetical protein [Tenacibaculum maritimum]